MGINTHQTMQYLWDTYKIRLGFVSVFLIAVFLRLWQLGTVPEGLTWDEAAIGYNGYSVITTRRDEWLHRLPISFQSFGDYKAPAAIYITGIFTVLFGLTPFVVRLPFFLASCVGLVAFSWWIYELWYDKKYRSQISLAALGLLSFSVWHVHYSRLGFESGMALSMLLLSLALWWYWIRQPLAQTGKYTLLSLSAWILWSASLYTYHSAKVVTPLVIVTVLIFHYAQLRERASFLIKGVLTATLLSLPLLYDSVFGPGLTRASTSIFSLGLSFPELIATIVNNVISHISLGFLLNGATTTLRHGDGTWGVLLISELALACSGIIVWVVSWLRSTIMTGDQKRIGLLAAAMLIIGVLPAAIGQEVPHSNRALFALVGWLLFALLAGEWWWNALKNHQWNTVYPGSHGEKDTLLKTLAATAIAVHLILFTAYTHNYYTQYTSDSASAFAQGYLEVFKLSEEYLNGKANVERVVITSEYGQPYIFALFHTKMSPITYQGGGVSAHYDFTDKIDWGTLRPNRLVVAGKSSPLDPNQAQHRIYGSDGSLLFFIFYVEREK